MPVKKKKLRIIKCEDADISELDIDANLEHRSKTYNENLIVPMNSSRRRKIVNGIIQSNKNYSIFEIVQKYPPVGWEQVFENSMTELQDISDKIQAIEEQGIRVVPDKNYIFRVFHMLPLNRVRVVILGQDPYQNVKSDGTTVAQGLSFSVKKGDTLQPSIRNIYTEINQSIPNFRIPNHGDLSSWVEQGVFLLNFSLTTDAGVSGAHSKIHLWTGFITNVLKAITSVNNNCIFLLWGKEAQKIKKFIDTKCIVLEAAHPSGFSANRGFFGCGHFAEVNRLLDPETAPKPAKGKSHHWSVLQGPINWNIE